MVALLCRGKEPPVISILQPLGSWDNIFIVGFEEGREEFNSCKGDSS
jgi:hypothetical protein